MKIVMVNKFLYPNGGSETYIFKLGKHLSEEGHQVEYFGMEDERNIVGNSTGSYTGNMNFHTSKLSKLFYPLKIIYSREAGKKIREVLYHMNPDVVHVNNFNFQLTPSILYEVQKYRRKEKRNVKLVFTAHDYQLICPNHMMKNHKTDQNCHACCKGSYGHCTKDKCIHGSLIKSMLGSIEAYLYQCLKTYRYFDEIICPSAFMKDQLSNNKNLTGKMTVLHNFVDEYGKKEQVNKESYVLFFGRYTKEKGIETLLEVCRRLPQIPFVFAGSGPLEEQVNEVTNINNLGFLGNDEMKSCIERAQFSICPSEWYENCPFSVIESQLLGTPVVGANIGGISELITESTGVLFESGNADDLYEKIKTLWDNTDNLNQLQEGCKQINFDTITNYTNKLMEIYTR